jgi:enediyne biosynthesis protein E4
MRRFLRVLQLAGIAAMAVLAAAGTRIRFEEIARKSGLGFELRNSSSGRFHSIELMVGGVAAFDFNNDGCADIYFTNGASIPELKKSGPEFHNRLYRNDCRGSFIDVTAKAGVAGEGYSMAVATGDFDNDGLSDIFVAGVNRNILYRNLGDGRFDDITERARLTGVDPEYGKMWSISAGWFDYDNDGLLDLFVSNYVAWDPAAEASCTPAEHRYYCHPNWYRGLPNQLFHNNGDGTFTDLSAKSGIARHIGKGMGVTFADFDDDGFTDVFVANDSVRSFLFHNQGDGTFRELGLEAGVALREDGSAIAGMGADFRDLDNDGRPDIVVTGMINDSFQLFRNLGKRNLFQDYGDRMGLLMSTRQLTGWSLGAYDFDNDGWKDLFFALAHFPRLERYTGRESALPNKVFRNAAGRTFEELPTGEAGLQSAAQHHGAAFADFDNDGLVDVVVSVLNGPAKLFRNTTTDAGQWLAFKLRGRQSNREGLGARVAVTLPDGRVLYNHAVSSVGYASTSEPLVRFGLGASTSVTKAVIRWPSGRTQTLTAIQPGQVLQVDEKDAE